MKKFVFILAVLVFAAGNVYAMDEGAPELTVGSLPTVLGMMAIPEAEEDYFGYEIGPREINGLKENITAIVTIDSVQYRVVNEDFYFNFSRFDPRWGTRDKLVASAAAVAGAAIGFFLGPKNKRFGDAFTGAAVSGSLTSVIINWVRAARTIDEAFKAWEMKTLQHQSSEADKLTYSNIPASVTGDDRKRLRPTTGRPFHYHLVLEKIEE